MMKRLTAIMIPVLLCAWCVPAHAVAVFYDGQTHTITDDTYAADIVYVDQTVVNDPGTHIDFLGGRVNKLFLYHNSSAFIDGGTVRWDLLSRDNARIDLMAGSARDLTMEDDSTVTLSGGTVEAFMTVKDNSSLTISDGSVQSISANTTKPITMTGGSVHYFTTGVDTVLNVSGGSLTGSIAALGNSVMTLSGGAITGSLHVQQQSRICLVGSGFVANGQPLGYGDKLSDYGIYTGTITGTLLDGTALNTTFESLTYDTAQIVIVPEPASLLLLATGGLLIGRRR